MLLHMKCFSSLNLFQFFNQTAIAKTFVNKILRLRKASYKLVRNCQDDKYSSLLTIV
jgi:hypothetical protein